MNIPSEPTELAMVVARFWSKVDTSGGPDACWPWTGCLNTTGYGQFRLSDGAKKSHRVAWRLSMGREIPDDLVIRHMCHEPTCNNPSHLMVGTHADNTRDAVEHGTMKGAVIRTHDLPLVWSLRAEGRSLAEIGRHFGASKSTICRILKGERRAADARKAVAAC